MADKKFKYVSFVTEVMTASDPHLSEPHTMGEYADGKYKTEATADNDYTERFKAEIQAAIDQHFAGKKNVHVPWKETKDGATAFNFKSPKKKPELFDAKGNPLTAEIIVRSGTLMRITGVVAAWERGSKRGVSLWLDAVRVIKLAEKRNPSAAFGPPENGFDVTDSALWCDHPECRFNRRRNP